MSIQNIARPTPWASNRRPTPTRYRSGSDSYYGWAPISWRFPYLLCLSCSLNKVPNAQLLQILRAGRHWISVVTIMKSAALKPAFNAKWVSFALGVGLVSLLLFLYRAFPESFSTKPFHVPNPSNSISNTEFALIPNIVHFVHLVDRSPDPVFEFPFRQFIAIYSAWHYLQPENIYIHTNVEQHKIDDALKKTKSPYTKAVIKLPGVSFRHATPPDHTKSGAAIDRLPNQSDFVRTVILGEMGGIYLDDDSYVLRDLKPLRSIGFDNIVGQQLNGRTYMAKSFHYLHFEPYDTVEPISLPDLSALHFLLFSQS